MCGDCEKILARLSSSDVAKLRRGAKAAGIAEKKGNAQVEQEFSELEEKTIDAVMQGTKLPEPDFVPLLLNVIYRAMEAGFDVSPRLPSKVGLSSRLSGPKLPAVKLPSNSTELRIWWDRVRHFKAPKRIQVLADKIKRAYLERVKSIFEKTSDDFISGAVWDKSQIRQAMKRAITVGKARANMIVATETTRYFNTARINYYDKVPTVTHYLFIAIRDKRTTPWCKTRQGLVYEKGSEFFRREKPPVHWNCRSEIVPLSPFNPRHKLLIEDASIQRANRKPEPLPKGWNE